MQRFRRHIVLLFALFVLIVPGTPSTTSAANIASREHTLLLSGAQNAIVLDEFTITGSGFTPGGNVYVMFFDGNGVQLDRSHWVTASPTYFAENGSMEPSRGYAFGGTIRDTLGSSCESADMVQAYDDQMEQLSNILLVDQGAGTCANHPAKIGPLPA
jgi:hypothetical protein